jgi:hypothetical protein
MQAKKLLVLAGSIGLTLAARAALSSAAVPVHGPLLDAAGRPAPGNVVGKGDPKPQPSDAGVDAR